MREKEYKKQEKGITLIALIITIIVMLILVAVTIQVTISGGIFSKAGEAVGKTKNSMNEEEEIMDKWVEKIDRIENGPNAPELIEGMIPVEWSEEKKAWVKADENTDDWYAYGTEEENKRWANAVTVKENGTKTAGEGETLIAGSKSRAGYQEAEAGTPILQDDILGMYVWIPRYAYKITKGYHEESTKENPVYGEVDIKFIGGTKDTISDGEIVEYNATTTSNFTHFPEGYVIHPAFNVETGSGIKRLTGIWVAKFEASSSDTTKENENLKTNYGSSDGTKYAGTDTESEPTVGGADEVTVRPNVTSWRNISPKNIYIACTNMVKAGNIQGLSTSADSHLMKDEEWGAVAYLTQSKYGNLERDSVDDSGVWNNSYFEGEVSADGKTSYYTTRTGMVGENKDDASSEFLRKSEKNEENNGKIVITYNNGDSEETKTFYEYNTENGVKGSTTGTIYGIYDMSGGAWEFQASYLKVAGVTNASVTYFNDNVPVKHRTIYSASGDGYEPTDNYDEMGNKARYGVAIWETSSGGYGYYGWCGASLYFFSVTHMFATRGGNSATGSGSGVFNYFWNTGVGNERWGFRPILWS